MTSAPTGGTPTSVSPSNGGALFRCTLVIGFSQTRSWFEAGELGGYLKDDSWELLWQSGAGINAWADPTISYWDRTPSSPCGVGSGEPERVILTITGNEETPWREQIARAVENVRLHYPSAALIYLQAVIGGPNHEPCTVVGREGTTVVRASVNNPVIDAAIESLVRKDVRAGPDLLVGSCAEYRDDLGHLTREAADQQARVIASFYS